MEEIAEGLWHGPGRRNDDLSAWSLFWCNDNLVAAIGLTPGRAHIGLPHFTPNGRSQGRVRDVSRSPGEWEDRIRFEAARLGHSPAVWVDAVRDSFLTLSERHGWTRPTRNLTLASVAVSAVWPSLLAASEAGSHPFEVPRWARDILSGPTPVDAIRRVLGPRATDPVVNAGAAVLQSEVAWWTLACTLATGSASPSIIGRILAIPSSGPLISDVEFAVLKAHLATGDGETVVSLLADTSLADNGPSRLIAAMARSAEDTVLSPTLTGVELSSLRPL